MEGVIHARCDVGESRFGRPVLELKWWSFGFGLFFFKVFEEIFYRTLLVLFCLTIRDV